MATVPPVVKDLIALVRKPLIPPPPYGRLSKAAMCSCLRIYGSIGVAAAVSCWKMSIVCNAEPGWCLCGDTSCTSVAVSMTIERKGRVAVLLEKTLRRAINLITIFYVVLSDYLKYFT